MKNNHRNNKLRLSFQVMTSLMLTLALALTLTLSAMAQSTWKAPAEADGYQSTQKATKASVAAGKKVYETYCQLCHGESGKGDGPSGASLGAKPANFTDKKLMKQTDGSLAWKILTGKGPMPSWAPVLKEDDIWNVINYLRTLKAL